MAFVLFLPLLSNIKPLSQQADSSPKGGARWLFLNYLSTTYGRAMLAPTNKYNFLFGFADKSFGAICSPLQIDCTFVYQYL